MEPPPSPAMEWTDAHRPPSSDGEGPSARYQTIALVVLLGVGLFAVAAILGPTSREVSGGAAIVLMLVLIAAKVPAGLAMLLSAALGLHALSGWPAVLSTLASQPFTSTTSWSFVVIPLFVLMGALIQQSGVSGLVYDAAKVMTGRLPGGLAVTTNVAGAGFGAITGSSIAVTYSLGKVAIPEMLRQGYEPRLAMSVVLCAGAVGNIIPPSILLVIYSGIAGTPVGPQLIAGVLPGLLLVVLMSLSVVAAVIIRPERAPRGDTVDASDGRRLIVLLRAWPFVAIAAAVVGGIFFGLVTATEAGAFGALGGMLLCLSHLGLPRGVRTIVQAAKQTVSVTASIMLLVIGATLLVRMMSLSRLPVLIVDTIDDVGLGRVTLLLLLVVVYLVLGMAFEPLTLMLLTVPILLPVLALVDVSPLWFGVFVVILGELAIITPPVGFLSFILHRLVQAEDVSLGHKLTLNDVYAAGMRFVPIGVLVVVLMIAFPELVEWLPSRTG